MIWAEGDTNFILDLLKQSPTVAALIYIVVTFLNHIRKADEARERLDEAKHKALETLGSGCHAFQTDLARRTEEFQKGMSTRNEVMFDKTTEALGRNSEALGRNSRALEKIEDLLQDQRPTSKTPTHN